MTTGLPASPLGGPSLREVSYRLQRGRVNPFSQLLLFASGVPRRLLNLVPVERTEFLVQGTGVLIAAALATVSAFVASGLIIDPAPHLKIKLIISALVGVLIFTIDRALVRSTLRPYNFPPDVLNAIWDPTADAKWYDVQSGSIYHESLGSRLRAFIGVLAKASIRFALAALIAYIVADVMVIAAFKPTVDARATYILQQQQKAALSAANSDLANANTQIASQRAYDLKQQQSDPEVKADADTVNALTPKVADLTGDVATLTTYTDDEENGITYTPPPLSPYFNKAQLPHTTGRRGCIQECLQDKKRLAQAEALLTTLNSEVAADQRNLQAAVAAAARKIAVALTDLNAQSNTALSNYNDATARAKELSTKPTGILIRKEALDQLEQDTKPWLQGTSPQSACSKSFHLLCQLKRRAFPSTPLGAYVGVFRAILILIDILPILLKIFYSMRPRRPYDVLVAALEEVSVADSVNKLDYELNHLGADMEDRAASRRGRRRGSGARFLRESRVAIRRNHRSKGAMASDDPRTENPESSRARRQGLLDWTRALGIAMRSRIRRQRPAEDLPSAEPSRSPWATPRFFEEE